jgi:hypothetical protein
MDEDREVEIEDDVAEEEEALGYFSADARNAATAQAMGSLVTYFAQAPSWGLQSSKAIGSAEPADEALATFVRMRVAVAGARRLEPVLARLLRHPSFLYSRQAEESLGALTGPLDVGRYVRTRLRHESPRRFPIQTIHRRFVTPENVMAAYAAAWIVAELTRAPLSLIPSKSPEYRAVVESRERCQRLLRHPVLVEASALAFAVRREGTLSGLLDTVGERLRKGQISDRDTYGDLLSWFIDFDPERATANPGMAEWAFYDERFDTKLFEVWSLHLLAAAMEKALGPPTAPMSPLFERSKRSLLEWNFGSLQIRLYFQAALSRLSTYSDFRWHYTEGATGDLRGYPDLAVEIDRVGQTGEVILIDPKLRQRTGPPSDELYKLLGYFGNLSLNQTPCGAIVFYSPSAPRRYRLETDGGGVVMAVGVDPVDATGSRGYFGEMAELVRERANISQALIAQFRNLAERDGHNDEALAALIQSTAVTGMLTYVATLPATTLAPTRKVTAAQLAPIWERLSPDTQTMLVTAEFFGTSAPNDADHSGPLLGLAATCERLVFELLLEAVNLSHPGVLEAEATLGTVIRWLSDACRNTPHSTEGTAIRSELDTFPQYDRLAVCHTTGDLRRLNVNYRIPAAHREVVPHQMWVEGRSLVVDATTGLVVRLVNALT